MLLGVNPKLTQLQTMRENTVILIGKLILRTQSMNFAQKFELSVLSLCESDNIKTIVWKLCFKTPNRTQRCTKKQLSIENSIKIHLNLAQILAMFKIVTTFKNISFTLQRISIHSHIQSIRFARLVLTTKCQWYEF